MASRWCSTRRGPTFRHELDTDYKGNRKETPDIFVPQVPLIPRGDRRPADPADRGARRRSRRRDRHAGDPRRGEGIDVIIVTGDRDSYQLVSDPHVKVLYNKRGVSDYALYDEAGIFERTGVTPRNTAELRSAPWRSERQPARCPGHRREDRRPSS